VRIWNLRQLAEKYRDEMALDELRDALDMTQQHLARILKINQAAVSKMEGRTDMYVSTLQDFVKAMGGRLRITATFPEAGTIGIRQFQQEEERCVREGRSGWRNGLGDRGIADQPKDAQRARMWESGLGIFRKESEDRNCFLRDTKSSGLRPK